MDSSTVGAVTTSTNAAITKAACLAPAQIEVLGPVVDVNGEGYSRDIGRSFILGGRTYYIFGDTFCKWQGEFVGLVNNTAALVPDPKSQPLQSQYLYVLPNGVSEGTPGLVEPLLHFTPEEKAMMARTGDGQDGECTRITLWGFGGVVEVEENGVGLHWYQKGIVYPGDDDNPQERNEYQGVGLARITVNKWTGRLSSERYPGLLFGRDEPKIGSFSATIEDGWLYLWGEHEEKVILARTLVNDASFRERYEFWVGYGWHHDWHKSVTIFEEIPQGQIFKSSLFGPEWPWAFVGVSKWADSKIRVGRSKTIEGPWDVICAGDASAPLGSSPCSSDETQTMPAQQGFVYCIYPHPWTVDTDEGALMVTWSEQWPGGVVAARLRFPTFDTHI